MRRCLQVAFVVCLTPAIVAAQSAAPSPMPRGAADRRRVRTLLKQGADVSAALGDGMSALHWAAERGDLAMAEMLIYGGANVEAVTRIGHYTPLHLAAKTGSGPVVRALLKAGANANAKSTNSGVTAAAPRGRRRQRGRRHGASRQGRGRELARGRVGSDAADFRRLAESRRRRSICCIKRGADVKAVEQEPWTSAGSSRPIAPAVAASAAHPRSDGAEGTGADGESAAGGRPGRA